MAVDLLVVALILIFQPLIWILWAALVAYALAKIAAWRAGKWADARVDNLNETAQDWYKNNA